MISVDIQSLMVDRLEYALGCLDLSPSYRQMILSLGERHLTAQIDHYKSCKPPVYLPSLCCAANDTDPRRVVGVSSAWFLLQLAAHLLDKVEDQELEVIGVSQNERSIYTNLSTGMIFVAEWILNHLQLDCIDAGAAWDIQRAFQEMGLAACSGQHLDLSVATPDLSTCWKIAEAKSGAAFALACYVGTRAATHHSERLRSMEKFGRYLGIIAQISDDMQDFNWSEIDGGECVALSPVAKAYLAHVWAHQPTVQINCSGCSVEGPSLISSLALYLRLEAFKYAELARGELLAVPLARDAQGDILALVHHLAGVGSGVN